MKDSRRPNPCSRPDLAARLAEWDAVQPPDRDALAEHVRTCPSCAPRWALLREAEVWLESASGERSPCPEPELLYDHGAGPGHRPLPAALRLGIEAHLERCGDCRELVATLATPPPLPLIDAPGAEIAGPADDAPAPRAAASRWRLVPREWRGFWHGSPAARVIPLAAALLVVTWVFVAERPWQTATVVGAPGGSGGSGDAVAALHPSLPTAPVLRGRAASPLLFPRGPVLASENSGASGGTVPVHPLRFEIEPPAGDDVAATEGYRIVLTRHDGSAFDTGETVAELTSAAPELVADELALAPGHYTWEAWRGAHGLELRLGARDFEVVVDAALLERLGARSLEPEPERTARLVRDLHEAGYLTDARALARSLPASAERDAYLESFPAR